jgi:hypothetical protein
MDTFNARLCILLPSSSNSFGLRCRFSRGVFGRSSFPDISIGRLGATVAAERSSPRWRSADGAGWLGPSQSINLAGRSLESKMRTLYCWSIPYGAHCGCVLARADVGYSLDACSAGGYYLGSDLMERFCGELKDAAELGMRLR